MPEVRGREFLSSIGLNANQTRVDSSKGGGSAVEQARIAAAMRNRPSAASGRIASGRIAIYEATNSEDGTASIADLPAGSYMVTARSSIDLEAVTYAVGQMEITTPTGVVQGGSAAFTATTPTSWTFGTEATCIVSSDATFSPSATSYYGTDATPGGVPTITLTAMRVSPAAT